jgi:hypothetical protein
VGWGVSSCFYFREFVFEQSGLGLGVIWPFSQSLPPSVHPGLPLRYPTRTVTPQCPICNPGYWFTFCNRPSQLVISIFKAFAPSWNSRLPSYSTVSSSRRRLWGAGRGWGGLSRPYFRTKCRYLAPHDPLPDTRLPISSSELSRLFAIELPGRRRALAGRLGTRWFWAEDTGHAGARHLSPSEKSKGAQQGIWGGGGSGGGRDGYDKGPQGGGWGRWAMGEKCGE